MKTIVEISSQASPNEIIGLLMYFRDIEFLENNTGVLGYMRDWWTDGEVHYYGVHINLSKEDSLSIDKMFTRILTTLVEYSPQYKYINSESEITAFFYTFRCEIDSLWSFSRKVAGKSNNSIKFNVQPSEDLKAAVKKFENKFGDSSIDQCS